MLFTNDMFIKKKVTDKNLWFSFSLMDLQFFPCTVMLLSPLTKDSLQYSEVPSVLGINIYTEWTDKMPDSNPEKINEPAFLCLTQLFCWHRHFSRFFSKDDLSYFICTKPFEQCYIHMYYGDFRD